MPPLQGLIFMARVVPTADAVGHYHLAPPGLETLLTLMSNWR